MLVYLRQGDASLRLSTIGATILNWCVCGTQLIDGYLDESELLQLDGYRSAVLVPWPNRIADGKWNDNGVVRFLDAAGNSDPQALHGLVFSRDFSIAELEESRIKLELIIEASVGYPYKIGVSVIYELQNLSLKVLIECTNLDDYPAPIGIGWHPYFFRSNNPVGNYQISGTHRINVDDRLIPNEFPFEVFSGFDNGIPDLWDYAITGVESRISFPTRNGLITMESNIASHVLGVGVWHIYSGNNLNRGALNSVAVEPCTVMADSLNRLLSIMMVQPGKKKFLSVNTTYQSTNV